MRPTGLFAFALTLLMAAPAAAQGYESSFRFGLGLDYGGLAGRGDGGSGGLRLQLGARLHENVAVFYQGQALVGVFVSDADAQIAVRNWNAAMVEAIWGVFSLAAGPSVDVGWGCTADLSQVGAQECGDLLAPGLSARAGVRFGVFTLSGDLHVSFSEPDPEVWVQAGIGVQLGDVATEPMVNPDTTDRGRPQTAIRRERRRVYRAPRRSLARRLDEPGLGLYEAPREPSQPTDEPRFSSPQPRFLSPQPRRFHATDVSDASGERPSATPRRPVSRPRAPAFDQLPAERSDDPIDGLPTR